MVQGPLLAVELQMNAIGRGDGVLDRLDVSFVNVCVFIQDGCGAKCIGVTSLATE